MASFVVLRKCELCTVRVDDADYDRVLDAGPWHINNHGYVARNVYVNGKRTGTQYLARFLMGEPDGLMVDHRNLDKLDNRSCNLRVATNTQNMRNASKKRSNTSGYKAVSWDKSRGKWIAFIRTDGKRRNLGRYETPEAAHAAYCRAAAELHGEFARSV